MRRPVTTVLTYCVPYVDPARIWFFPVLGLAAPGIYVASVVLMLYWVIRWRKVRALVMLAVVVAGLFKVSLFWRPETAAVMTGRPFTTAGRSG